MIYIMFLSLFFDVLNCSDILESKLSQKPNKTIIVSRKSRTLLPAFPDESTIGYLLAVSVPLNLPNEEVFFSYNFEANYNMPSDADFVSFADLTKYGIGRSQAQDHDHNNKGVKNAKKKHKAKKNQKKLKSKKISRKRRFLDRNLVFRVVENKLISLGFSKTCLLRAICEVASAEYGYNNGVLGDIFHILFTPTASMDDGIDLSYYKAEHRGNSGDCTSYYNGCPKSILDFFTVER